MKTFFRKLSLPILLMAPFALLCVLTICSHLMAAAFADGTAPPAITDSLLALFNAIQGHATAAVVLMFVFQVLRTNEVIGILGKIGLAGKSLQVVVAIITALGYVFNAYATGGNLLQAAVEGLFTSGGAMLVYDAMAGIVPPAAAPAPALSASALTASVKTPKI